MALTLGWDQLGLYNVGSVVNVRGLKKENMKGGMQRQKDVLRVIEGGTACMGGYMGVVYGMGV